MSELPAEFDLKFLPDWLKEQPASNPYADFAGDSLPEHSRGGPDRRGERRDSRRPAGRGEARGRSSSRPGEQRRGDRPQRFQAPGELRTASIRDAPRPDRSAPEGYRIEFLPDENCVVSIARQIKASSRAYPLFGLAKMFLERPERHQVRISLSDHSKTLFRCGDSLICLDAPTAERHAFSALKEKYYIEETVAAPPVKGNFSNVARCRLSGTILGPTNHHEYQPLLRKLYEERFSRRMSFPDYQREIQIITDPEIIAQWKERSRSLTTYKLKETPEAPGFRSAAEAEQHFRQHYLADAIQPVTTAEIDGTASRNLPDLRIGALVRQEWEKQRAFPSHLGQQLRHLLVDAGLHIFKHRKRMLFVSALRPNPFKTGPQSFSENIGEIVRIIESTPRCSRSRLAAEMVKAEATEADAAKIKSSLAADLHWLIHAGKVIEFHDGTLEFPLPLRPPHTANVQGSPVGQAAATPATPAASEEAPSVPGAEEEEETPRPAQGEDVGEPPSGGV